ncbi:MAG: type 4a pilus biogenesis protein PilO [Phycisphaeraceae bacterium]|nr:type 4a pilus biogenesis protein PilO [Phycisphaeraceae bacterium]MCB9847949.1 type 4a pilus biogenesis protein PilO [Phycisphaeraceae bacterium]
MKFGTREFLFVLVLLAVPVASWWFVFKAQNEEIAQANQEITHKEAMLEKLDAATAKSEDLKKINEDIWNEIQVIESRLPSDKEVDVILQQVAQIALSNNLKLPKVKSAKPVTAAKYMEQPLEMKIEGDFDAFYTFLLEVERLDRITRLPDMVIKRSDKIDGMIEAEFTLSIYFEQGKPGRADS